MTNRIVPAAGVALTVWDANGLRHALDQAPCRELLEQARPDIVQLHEGPRGMVSEVARAAARVREILPNVRLWAGIGCDGWLDGVTAGARTLHEASGWLLHAADAAIAAGVECVVWNAESAYKRNPRAGTQLAGIVISRLRLAHRTIAQGHTAFDHPTYHSDVSLNGHGIGPLYSETSHAYPWRAWCGPDLDEYPGCVDFVITQNYAAPEQVEGQPPIMAGRGALAHRIATSSASFETAKRLGWVLPDMPIFPYVQAHHVPFAQTVTCTAEREIVGLWAAPSRLDRDGAVATRALCEMRRRGHVGPGAVDRLLLELRAAGKYSGAIDHVFGAGAARGLGLIS